MTNHSRQRNSGITRPLRIDARAPQAHPGQNKGAISEPNVFSSDSPAPGENSAGKSPAAPQTPAAPRQPYPGRIDARAPQAHPERNIGAIQEPDVFSKGSPAPGTREWWDKSTGASTGTPTGTAAKTPASDPAQPGYIYTDQFQGTPGFDTGNPFEGKRTLNTNGTTSLATPPPAIDGLTPGFATTGNQFEGKSPLTLGGTANSGTTGSLSLSSTSDKPAIPPQPSPANDAATDPQKPPAGT